MLHNKSISKFQTEKKNMINKNFSNKRVTFSHKEEQIQGLQRFRASYPSPLEADTVCAEKQAVDIYTSKFKFLKKSRNKTKQKNEGKAIEQSMIHTESEHR